MCVPARPQAIKKHKLSKMWFMRLLDARVCGLVVVSVVLDERVLGLVVYTIDVSRVVVSVVLNGRVLGLVVP